MVYYGTNVSEPAELKKIHAPILGLYGEDDARVNTTIPPADEQMKKLGKPYTHHIYQGAGHGFLRSGEASDAPPADRTALEQAWERWKKLLGA